MPKTGIQAMLKMQKCMVLFEGMPSWRLAKPQDELQQKGQIAQIGLGCKAEGGGDS
jgi:hypothetical protein